VVAHGDGQIVVALPPPVLSAAHGGESGWGADRADFVVRIAAYFRSHAYLAAHHLYCGGDAQRLAYLAVLGERVGLPLVATNDVLYHVPERRPLHAGLNCIPR